MARIRTIKPEFFTSADILELTPLSRLFYISLWCESDREGRLNWNRKTLMFRYFPSESSDNFNSSVDELVGSGLIMLYKVDGREYCFIPSFLDHQSINNRESESRIPAPNASNGLTDASLTRESGVQGEGKGKEGKGKEGKGTGAKRKTSIPDDFPLTEKMKDWFSKQSFCIDMQKSTNSWIDAMRAKDYKYIDWESAWRNGMRKHDEWQREKGGGNQQQSSPKQNGFDKGFEV